MNDNEYASFVRAMSSIAGLKSNVSRRRGMEQTYFLHHKRRGTRLRGKYRP